MFVAYTLSLYWRRHFPYSAICIALIRAENRAQIFRVFTPLNIQTEFLGHRPAATTLAFVWRGIITRPVIAILRGKVQIIRCSPMKIATILITKTKRLTLSVHFPPPRPLAIDQHINHTIPRILQSNAQSLIVILALVSISSGIFEHRRPKGHP